MIILEVLGVLCIVYGVMVFALRSGTGFFAVWLALGVVFMLFAVGLRVGWWEALPTIGKRVAQGVVAVALIWLVATQALVIGGFRGSGGNLPESGLDCIIVLGAQVRADGPSPVLQYRLDTAYDYLAAHRETRCIVSGGQGPNEAEPEAVAMARYLAERGIDEARISIEDESQNTVQNISNSMRYLDAQSDSVGIVTNNFHVYRGCALARKQGIAHVYGIPAPSNALYLPNNMLRESFGITKDFISGNL